MSNELAVVSKVAFEDKNVTTITYKGKPCWIAKEVGVALGYDNGGAQLAQYVTAEWKDEFVEGEDYIVLKSAELAEFKKIFGDNGESPLSLLYTARLTLLFESGINICCIKTDKPAGKKLRRFLATEVIPQINRTGAYLSEPVKEALNAQMLSSQAEIERCKVRMAELQRLNHQDVHAFLAKMNLAPNVRAKYEALTLQQATGINMLALLPHEEPWVGAVDIAKKLGLGENYASSIGRLAKKIGVQGNHKYWRKSLQPAKGVNNHLVDKQEYNEEAVKLITEAYQKGANNG